jgi:predicted transposase/invertase (TIGR01784 family)
MKIVREKPLLTMIGIKDPEELDKYSEKMAISSIKESVDKLKTLNSDKKFVYNITPEQDDILTKNTLKKIYKSEGIAEGLAEGEAKGKIEAQREMTINLLKNNYPIEEIAKITGLSKEEIKNISKTI